MVTYPEDWTPMQLKDLGYIQMCRRIFQSQTKAYGAIPFYKISTFGGKADAYISQELYEQYKGLYPYPEKGDILISAAGTVGKTVIFDGRDSYFQDSNIVWLKVDKNAIDRKFLWWFYRSHPWKALEGTTIQRLYNSIILKTEIHLPEKPEQEEIARTLSMFDTYIDDLAELIEKKRDIRDGALEDLMSGRTRLEGYKDIWQIVKLKEITSLITKGTTPFDKSGRGSVHFIKVENIDDSSSNINITQNISEKEHNGYLKRSRLAENDILFSIAGTLGRVTIIDKTLLPANTNQALAIIRLSRGNHRFISYYLKSRTIKKYIQENPTVGAQPNLSLKQIGNLIIAFPSEKEQEAIANTLTAMDTEIEALEIERDKMIQIREGAMNDLLTGHVRLKM